MELKHCDLHNLNIKIYTKEEESDFIDDNQGEIAIFTNDEGKKYLKRLIVGQCDEDCETIKELLI